MGTTKQESRQKQEELRKVLLKNPKATYDEIEDEINVSRGFISRHRNKILNELRRENKITQEFVPYSNFSDNNPKTEDKSSPEKQPSIIDLFNELKEVKAMISNNFPTKNKGGKNMPLEEKDVQGIIQNWWSGEQEKLKKDIRDMFQNTVKDMPNMFKRMQEEEEKRKEEREKAEKELEQRIENITKKVVEPIRKLVCDEQGNCRLATKEEIEELKKEGKIVESEETGTEEVEREDTDQKFLEEAKNRTYLSSQLLDIILAEPENDKVAVAKRIMERCTTEEECNRLKEYICQKHPTLCTLVTEKLEERKKAEQKKGHWLESSKEKEEKKEEVKT